MAFKRDTIARELERGFRRASPSSTPRIPGMNMTMPVRTSPKSGSSFFDFLKASANCVAALASIHAPRSSVQAEPGHGRSSRVAALDGYSMLPSVEPLQDSHEQPSRHDPKYRDGAFVNSDADGL